MNESDTVIPLTSQQPQVNSYNSVPQATTNAAPTQTVLNKACNFVCSLDKHGCNSFIGGVVGFGLGIAITILGATHGSESVLITGITIATGSTTCIVCPCICRHCCR